MSSSGRGETLRPLETTNEELQSTNEELETTNEELEAANSEFRDRGMELDRANAFLQSVLASVRSGVIVVNGEMSVRTSNKVAEDMWGLRADEVDGSHFLNLDIGLPVDQLRRAIRACLNGSSAGEHVELLAVNRRGRQITCAVDVSPLREDEEVIGSIVLLDER